MRKRKTSPEFDHVETGEDSPGNDRQFVTALQRGLDILRCFKPNDDSLGNFDLAERSGLRPSTVSRLTYTLSKLGYLRYDQKTGRYRLGVAVLGLGFACLSGLHIREIAQARMQVIADTVGDGALIALTARDNLQMTYIACARSEGVMSLQLTVGSRVSLARSAAGRAYLGALPDKQQEIVLEEIKAGTDPTEWPTLKADIEDAIGQVQKTGYCLSLGQWRPHVNAVGVAFKSFENGEMPYAITCGGPSYILPRRRLVNDVAPLLLDFAQEITGALRR